MPLQVIEAQTGESPVATILIMHGLGADGRDFVPIAEQIDLSDIGPVRYLFPNAPTIPVTINGGYVMPAWYDILAADLVKREDEAGLRSSRVEIEALIANEKSTRHTRQPHRGGGLFTGLRHGGDGGAAPCRGIGGHCGHVGLFATGWHHGSRAHGCQLKNTDFHGPRHA